LLFGTPFIRRNAAEIFWSVCGPVMRRGAQV
jgi:hypothetical protein